MQQPQDRSRGTLLGLAIGDAIGTTLEFRPPGSFRPLTDMVGGGHFCLKKGYWTDDTSMALCLGHSLVACQRFDATDQMQRYCDWLDNGYMSSIGTCFDVGVTVSSALRRFQKTGNPYAGAKSRWSSGNGSIMRLAPIAIACSHDIPLAQRLAAASSRTTHAAPLCLDSCGLLASVLIQLLHGHGKAGLEATGYAASSHEVEQLQRGHWQQKSYQQLKTAWRRRSGVSITPTTMPTACWPPPIWAMMPTPQPPSQASLPAPAMGTRRSAPPGAKRCIGKPRSANWPTNYLPWISNGV